MKLRFGTALLLLAGCAGQPPQWTKEGASAEQLYADRKNCERAATTEVERRFSRGAGTMGPAVVGPPGGRRAQTNPTPFADARGTQQGQEDELVRECMEHAVPLRVPLKVDFGSGKNWLEAH